MEAGTVSLEFYADTLGEELIAAVYAKAESWPGLAEAIAKALRKHYRLYNVQVRVMDNAGDEINRREM